MSVETTLLLDYWNPLVERCGIILETDKVVELQNIHPFPNMAFRMRQRDFPQDVPARATWHTHPTGSANLSSDDYDLFLGWPKLVHFIVGRGIVWGYYVQNGEVFRYADDLRGVSA